MYLASSSTSRLGRQERFAISSRRRVLQGDFRNEIGSSYLATAGGSARFLRTTFLKLAAPPNDLQVGERVHCTYTTARLRVRRSLASSDNGRCASSHGARLVTNAAQRSCSSAASDMGPKAVFEKYSGRMCVSHPQQETLLTSLSSRQGSKGLSHPLPLARFFPIIFPDTWIAVRGRSQMDSLMRDGTEAEQINAGPSDRSDCKFVPTPARIVFPRLRL